MKRRAILVLELAVDAGDHGAAQLLDVVRAVNPLHVPHFTGVVLLAADGYRHENVASYVVDYLQGMTPDDATDWCSTKVGGTS